MGNKIVEMMAAEETSNLFVRIGPPWVVACVQGDEFSNQATSGSNTAFQLKEIDGTRSRSIEDFYVQLADILQFPHYFGRNLNALMDCMEDELSKDSRPLVIRITNADHFLVDSSVDALHGVLSTFASIGSMWSAGVNEGEAWDSPPRKFLLILEYV